MSTKSSKITCPICEGDVAPRQDNKAFPFCSKRCKMEDLGKWFDGEYAVAGPPAAPEEIAQELHDQYSRRRSDS